MEQQEKPLYYILDGHTPRPVDMRTWAAGSRMPRLACTELRGVRVSTIFLSLDHGFSEDGPPLVFETMVLGSGPDEYARHYSTWEEAMRGHDEVVEMVRKGAIDAEVF